jgi:acyl carrier protein
MSEVKQELRDYIVDTFLFGDTEIEFNDNDSFIEKGIINSTAILEVITFLEEKYGVKIEDDEILPENLDSLDNISSFIGKKVNN